VLNTMVDSIVPPPEVIHAKLCSHIECCSGELITLD